ncbi:DUF2235 domain-containing protein [Paraburkholderia sp. J76]|uniref:DUF2235 domain-containing protein n=1 Tax=Paraburkholderia sp. J76 TaxID=2805439 RepID=UPI002ABE6B83|nr:DUF2235 domain-containing protein [Paraburkholderia sp. J76]
MGKEVQLDPADKTPVEVKRALALSQIAYPKDQCIPCGAVVHIGFFFDGFGRSRDLDDRTTSRYSNICRLWEAHRDNKDDRRHSTPNHFWYRFYYSGLGTPLNDDAKGEQLKNLGEKTLKESAKFAGAKATDLVKKVAGIDKITDVKPTDATQKELKNALTDYSFRPVVKVFNEMVDKSSHNIGRALTIARDNRWVRRGRAASRALLFDVAENPMKIGEDIAKDVFVGVLLDSIPWCRDSRAAARLFGTGVEDRIAAAKAQLEEAVKEVKLKMPKIQRIQVSIFGADRGCVIARAFANEINEKYELAKDGALAFSDPEITNGTPIPITIKFMGLLDAVSSLMQENKLLSMVPVVGMIKQNFSDQHLAVPESVERCVHFAAAHELRFCQRLDSLEKTRGVQYLYPGTSEDITGGSPAGTLGARAELQRVVLRDMLNEAFSSGAVVDCMEDMARAKPGTFQKFTLASPIKTGNESYKIWDLIGAYREMVPYTARLNFIDHMQVFLRWMATRYQSPAFRETITSQFDTLDARHRQDLAALKNAQAAEAAARAPGVDAGTWAAAQARALDAQQQEIASFKPAFDAKQRPVVGIWDRIQSESDEMIKREAGQTALRQAANQLQDQIAKGTVQPWGTDRSQALDMIQADMMSVDQQTLVQAWKTGLEGTNPLPAKVMALFDLLVHDTMLTSWHDHLLSSTLYFQTRATDAFGTTDFVKDEKKRVLKEKVNNQASKASATMNAGERAPGMI